MSKPTVAEVFAIAGYPVHESAWLVYWSLPDVSDKAWFYLDHNDPSHKCLYWMPHEKWEPASQAFWCDGEEDLIRGQIYESVSLSNLPAKDAWDVLPEVVKEHSAVREKMEADKE